MSTEGERPAGPPPDPARAGVAEVRAWFDVELDAFLPSREAEPRLLHQAMRYACEGGKRVRPLLCLGAATACGGDPRHGLPAALALELVHAYSLVHDDLPALDDDVERRGRPTVHAKFGEALGLLTGDALLTAAFAALSGAGGSSAGGASPCPAMVRELALAAGSLGMVGGQVVDVTANPVVRPGSGAGDEAGDGIEVATTERLSVARYVAEHKTGALLRTACRLGGLAAAAEGHQMAALTRFGAALGFAYQVLDDLGDEVRDRAQGRWLNFAVLLGPEEARATADRALGVAAAALGGTAWPGPRRWLDEVLAELIRA